MSESSPELPKTMLIIKSHASALTVVEAFLRNRGWNIYSTPNLKDALLQLVQNKPSYVLITVDHANKKVRALPKVLSSAFPVVTMTFAENQNAASYKLLNDTPTEYRVYPPVTGPAIERCVNKYLKDQQTTESLRRANESFSVGGGGDNGSFSVKGGSENTSQLLAQFLGENIGSTVTSPPSAETKDNNLIFAQPVEDSDFSGIHVQKGVKGDLGKVVPTEEPSAPVYSENQGGAANNLHSTKQEGVVVTPQGSREYRRQQESKNPAWTPVAQNENPLSTSKATKSSRGQEASDTLIARGAQKSLEESVVPGDGKVTQKLESTASMACIVVESPRFSGYLVAVMGRNQSIDSAFIETIKQRLFKFLKENGEDVSEEEAMGLKVKQVDFEPWAVEYAEFLRKSVHKGNEVAMAFFPRRPVKQILEDSHHHEMAKIGLGELKGDTAVEFDLYMYLPNNNKYVLYTPKGGIFYNKQLDRLKNLGITHMHVQKEDATAISKYQAQNYLNELVDDYDQKQALVKKIKAS